MWRCREEAQPAGSSARHTGGRAVRRSRSVSKQPLAAPPSCPLTSRLSIVVQCLQCRREAQAADCACRHPASSPVSRRVMNLHDLADVRRRREKERGPKGGRPGRSSPQHGGLARWRL